MQVLPTLILMKKMLYPPFILALLSAVLLLSASAQAQSGNKWTKKQAAKWYNSQVWLNGLALKPHAATDPEEFARLYHANQPAWDKHSHSTGNQNCEQQCLERHHIASLKS